MVTVYTIFSGYIFHFSPNFYTQLSVVCFDQLLVLTPGVYFLCVFHSAKFIEIAL